MTEPAFPVLTTPAEGVPLVIASERELDECAQAIGSGHGPVALDAERASGYRYGQRAYLVQVRREGAGTWLIDPVALPDLAPLQEAIGGAEWLLHAATQDLSCLREVGLRPAQIFDTELAGRLLGLPRVGLAAVVEHYLGVTLEKEHSAVDWSTRPLPEPWLRYAALDVEVLVELRNLMGIDLAGAGKSEWARQEFAALIDWEQAIKPDPWRRIAGVARLRSPRDQAAAREIWRARDALAQRRDIAPGRILPDRELANLAASKARTAEELPSGPRTIAQNADLWLSALRRARDLPEDQLPQRVARADGPPPPRAWPDKRPEAARRLQEVRAALGALALEREIPVENLCSPDALRRVIWSGSHQVNAQYFDHELSALGVRPWQRELIIPILLEAWPEPII